MHDQINIKFKIHLSATFTKLTRQPNYYYIGIGCDIFKQLYQNISPFNDVSWKQGGSLRSYALGDTANRTQERTDIQSIKQILVLPTITVCQSTVLTPECPQDQARQRTHLHVDLFTNTIHLFFLPYPSRFSRTGISSSVSCDEGFISRSFKLQH